MTNRQPIYMNKQVNLASSKKGYTKLFDHHLVNLAALIVIIKLSVYLSALMTFTSSYYKFNTNKYAN